MAKGSKWGRVEKIKQEAFPGTANDCCGGIREWDRYPAWTEAMREALERHRGSKRKWHSLIDRVYAERHLEAAWKRIDDRTTGKARSRGAGVMEEMKIRKSETGTPQGGIVSPLLANIYLHAVDEQLQAEGIRWVRYTDDLVLLCRSREEAEAALEQLREMLREMGLSLSEEKTRIADLEDGFDFLGGHYRGNKRWPRRKSEQKLRAKLRRRTRRNRPGSMQEICSDLEPILRGWFNYFCEGNSGAVFRRLTGWLRHRLRSIERRRHNRHGRATQWDNIRYPNRYFTGCGFFDLEEQYRVYGRRHSLRP